MRLELSHFIESDFDDIAATFLITKTTAEQEYDDLKTDYDSRMWIDEVYLFNL